jgi:hypothetical protein
MKARIGRMAITIAACCGVLALACGTGDDCSVGTKVCIGDSDTCTCAPPCASVTDCHAFATCDAEGACQSCRRGGGAGICACAASLCLPLTWSEGETVRFVRVSTVFNDAGAPIAPPSKGPKTP